MTQMGLIFTDTERLRLTGNRARVLAYLKAHGSATNAELTRPEVGGLRGVGRVWELERMGYRITRTHVSGGTHLYTLEGR